MPAHMLQRPPSTSGGATPSASPWQRLWNFFARRTAGAGRFGMRLAAGQELRLHDAAGWTVVCRSGSVWITQEADARDIFLDAGEGFALDRGGLALILARRDAALAIRPPATLGPGKKRA